MKLLRKLWKYLNKIEMKQGKDFKILIKVAHAGGKVLREYFGKVLKPVEKSTLWDFQTEADLESEKSILAILKTKFPKYNIYSEEEGKIDNDSDYTFVIDPLDGTNNFVLGIPNFSVSVALFHKSEAIVGVVYQPILDQTYYAIKGKGAFLNGKKIKVNNVINSEKITIAYGCGYKTKRNYIAKIVGSLINSDHKRIITNWSVAHDYCLLACGKIESVISDGMELYDYGAGKLIAKEAGAQVVDFTGKKEIDYTNNGFVISNTSEINNYVFNIIKPLQKRR